MENRYSDKKFRNDNVHYKINFSILDLFPLR